MRGEFKVERRRAEPSQRQAGLVALMQMEKRAVQRIGAHMVLRFLTSTCSTPETARKAGADFFEAGGWAES